jgi:hypothetical protein
MLHILAAIFIISLLNPAFVRANFFEEKDTPVQESECSGCSKEIVNLNADLKEKVSAIDKRVSSHFNKQENPSNNEITLFIDPGCGFSDAAVKALVKFKKDNPGWKVKGVIVTNGVNLKERLLQKQSYFTNDIEFSIDLSGNRVKQFSIQKTPAFVITYNGRYYKIIGQPDLNETISKLNK